MESRRQSGGETASVTSGVPEVRTSPRTSSLGPGFRSHRIQTIAAYSNLFIMTHQYYLPLYISLFLLVVYADPDSTQPPPDQPETSPTNEILTLVLNHSYDLEAIETISRINRHYRDQAKISLHVKLEQILTSLFFAYGRTEDKLAENLCRAIHLCAHHTNQDLILNKILTDANAGLLMRRLAVLDQKKSVIEKVISLVKDVPGFRRAAWRWGTGLENLNNISDMFECLKTWAKSITWRPDPSDCSLLPRGLLDLVDGYATEDPDEEATFRRHLPKPFSRLSRNVINDLTGDIGKQFGNEIRSNPDIVRILYSFSVSMPLDCLPWTEFHHHELQAVLPYVWNVPKALLVRFEALAATQKHVIKTCLYRDEFLFNGPSATHGAYLCACIEFGHPDLLDWMLRLPMLETILGSWVNESLKARNNGVSLLHLAVQFDSIESIRVLLSHPNLIAIDAVDSQGRTALECVPDLPECAGIRALLTPREGNQ